MSYSEAAPSHSMASQFQQFDPSTPPPPPPPPKPSSGRETPARGPPLPPPPPDHHGSNAQHPTNQHYYAGTEARNQVPLPLPEPGWLPPGIHDLSTNDLKHLIENPTLQAALLSDPENTHPSIPASQEALRQLLDSNIALATSLQQLESRLSHQRAATQSRLLALRALERQHKSKIVETEDTLRGFSPMALYQQLNASVQDQDALLKGVEDSFLDEPGLASDREVADFVRRVRDAKRVAFLRNERKERWDEGRVGGWR